MNKSKGTGTQTPARQPLLPGIYRKKPLYLKREKKRRDAMRRGLRWDIDLAQYKQLMGKPCTYCGWGGGVTLDQIIPGAGYTQDNVVPACFECNVAKNAHFTYQEAKEFIGPAIKAIRQSRVSSPKVF